MELTENEIEMHTALINKIFQNDPERFFTNKAIVDSVKQTEWVRLECIGLALEKMTERGQIERDPVYGFCKAGKKESLRAAMKEQPPMSRSDFDRLTQAEKAAYCESGGRIAG
jgi:hypothetical protein